MSNRGGARRGAGRKKGSVASHRKLANEATARSLGEGMTPLEYLLNLMRDETADIKRRDDAAKAAAPFIHARLSAVAVTDPGVKHDHGSKPISETASWIAGLLGTGSDRASEESMPN